MLRGGAQAIGESRIENIERLRHGGIGAPIVMLRAPMLSQADRVVATTDTSLNSEIDVIQALSRAARSQRRTHQVVLMVELGDLREGVMAECLDTLVNATLQLPNIKLHGIGANLACQHGVAPDVTNMAVLSQLCDQTERAIGLPLTLVSGGNSANLNWVTGNQGVGRVNNLRIGEAILLGRETLDRTAFPGLRTEAFKVVGEVIESLRKPAEPWGTRHATTFEPRQGSNQRLDTLPNLQARAYMGEHVNPDPEASTARLQSRVIVALGHQDTDPDGLTPHGIFRIVGASSDHLILDTGAHTLAIGTEVKFSPDYKALLRAMTSPFVEKVFV